MYFDLELRGPHAGELSYVLGKHPDRLFEWEVHGSMVRVFFPHYADQFARVSVLYWPEASQIPLKSAHPQKHTQIDPRAYGINSLFCTALKVAFNAAITGHRKAPAEVLERVHDLSITLSPVSTYLSSERLTALFEPLGYRVVQKRLPVPDLEFSIRHPTLLELTLSGPQRVVDALRHVLVLTPVLDSDRHEYMGQGDVDRLRLLGGEWLESHADRTFIISRYLVYRRLIDAFVQAPRGTNGLAPGAGRQEDGYDIAAEPLPLRVTPEVQRNQIVMNHLMSLRPRVSRLLLIGCTDGRLLSDLIASGAFDQVVGMDSSPGVLERARKRIERGARFSSVLESRCTRYELFVSALGYRDPRLRGFDLVCLVGHTPHEDEGRLRGMLSPILEDWRPASLMWVIPNREATQGEGRRRDSPAEWDLETFRCFCVTLPKRESYGVEVRGLGPGEPSSDAPLLMATFRREGGSS